MEETQGQRLERLRRAKGLGQKELGKAVGRSESWVSNVESGKIAEIKMQQAVLMANALGVTLDELQGKEPTHEVTATREIRYSVEAEIGRAVMQLVDERRNIIRGPQIRVVPDVFRVPVVNGMSATALASEVSQVEQWIEVPASLLNGATRPAAYVIVGDCLWDRWGIKTGDTLIIDLANTDPRDGQIVAARINDAEETAKEFHRVADGVDLRPTSPGYNTIEVRDSDQLLIIGVYVTHLVTGKR